MKIKTTMANIFTIWNVNLLETLILSNEKSDPFLVCSALSHCCLRNHDQLQNGLVSLPEVMTHLVIAETHSKHWGEVGQEEEQQVVTVEKHGLIQKQVRGTTRCVTISMKC
jgi:hypothetical protein